MLLMEGAKNCSSESEINGSKLSRLSIEGLAAFHFHLAHSFMREMLWGHDLSVIFPQAIASISMA